MSAADPLNLTGIVTAGERIRAVGRTRIIYRGGVPVAVMEADALRYLVATDHELVESVAAALTPQPVPAIGVS